MAKPVQCTKCGSPYHYQSFCPLNRKPIKVGSLPKVHGKQIKPGKAFNNWRETREEWYRLNPPDHAGYYYCHYCGKAMTREESTLDHKLLRSRYPQFRYDLNNLLICCFKDNSKRGSMEYELFCKRYYPHLLVDNI